MEKIRHADKKGKLQKRIAEWMEIVLCPYEDEQMAFFMKLVFLFIWVISIGNGLLSGASVGCFAALGMMNLGLLLNLAVSRTHRELWIDVVTFVMLCFPAAYIFYYQDMGYLSIIFLLLYGCGVIFILGIRDSLIINVGFFLLVWHCFRWDTVCVVRQRYGDNIAMRFPYLFVCVLLIVYCLMYMIQRFWVQKRKSTKILEERILEERQKLDRMSMRVMDAMLQALGAKIPGKEEHCRAVAEYARKIAVCKGMDEWMCTEAYRAGLLHEIGMIGIPDKLISRTDLTDEEYEQYKTYVDKSYEIISAMQSVDMHGVAEAVRCHREHWDGSGFLMGLAGEEIPPLARIITVADYTDRHLRYGESREAVTEQLLSQKGKAFEEECVKIMAMILEG